MKIKPNMSEALRTQREFARAVGRSVSTVNGWLRHDAWPFRRQAPWPRSILPAVKVWRQNWLRYNADDELTPADVEELDRYCLKQTGQTFAEFIGNDPH